MSDQKYPIVGPDSLMSKKEHGTSAKPVQDNLRWGVDQEQADKICSFNRHSAEHSGYFKKTGLLESSEATKGDSEPIEFRDSVTGKVVFSAPKGRSMEEFIAESKSHGWPSFRDQEVNWETVRCLGNGECVSVDGTHLGHNLPDKKGNRYCINLVSISGNSE
eukprot:CAMPEP_0201488818 /NCGR_PEP_ID=MMETSP0151_2-20130828/19573_1 /ASSEMBLY_ACC=CAM_ASM_000257 /TAXON_ID=200890 /ORGANISM="Paramoeba atlantica, Strain 621/1 / CCAP 1560/9" /LENGTH=161 /DNA_ID=CAMNT_0047874187 /DNA_START=69 /DNA_END=554 /DNA_ORIENTATION=+